MRILLVNQTARFGEGGGNRVVVDTCNGLADAGHDVAVATHDSTPSTPDVRVPVLPLGPQREGEACVSRVLEHLDAFQPEVVQVHFTDVVAMLPALERRVPTCLFLHDQSWFCSAGDRTLREHQPCHRRHGIACLAHHYLLGCGGRRPDANWIKWRRVEERRVLHKLARVRIQVASTFMREGLFENGYPAERIDVVPLYAAPAAVSEPVEPGLIFAPARLVPVKGIHVLIDALAGLHGIPWRLVIAGDGFQRSTLESQVRRLGVPERVRFLGEIPPGEVARWYARAQLIAVPILRHEPFGMVGPEAKAYGKPVVTFGGGGVDEWLPTGRGGVRVPERTADSLREAFRRWLPDRDGCGRLGREAMEDYGRFSPASYLARLVAAFEAACAWHGRAAPR